MQGVGGGPAKRAAPPRESASAARAQNGGAIVSGRYRYLLWRELDRSSPDAVLFVMLNPSTADASHDDPTLRRCVRFAERWGFGRLEVANLFALRTPDPRDLARARDPVGPRNDEFLARAITRAHCVVAAWGVMGGLRGRALEVGALFEARAVVCLGVTKRGEPRHPLYVRSDAALAPLDLLRLAPR